MHSGEDGGERLPLRLHSAGLPGHRSSRDLGDILSGKHLHRFLLVLKTRGEQEQATDPQAQGVHNKNKGEMEERGEEGGGGREEGDRGEELELDLENFIFQGL